jgi:uncharacterized protein YuzE
MRIKYFQDTDTLYIEFRSVDRDGNICGITIEHARDRVEIPKFSYEQISA